MSGNDLVCSQCNVGYYKATDNSCIGCKASCTKCTSDTVCQECSAGYYLNASTCTQCGNNCAKCDSKNCLQCNAGYFSDVDPNTSNKICYRCPEDCLTCQSPGFACDTCPKNYEKKGFGCVAINDSQCLYTNEEGCVICQYGFYLKNGVCLRCID